MAAQLATPTIRVSSFAIALALVALLALAALMAQVELARERGDEPAAVTSIWSAPREIAPMAPRARAPSPAAPSPATHGEPAPAQTQSLNLLAATRCATAQGRRENAALCGQGREFAAPAYGGDIAPAPVEGGRSNEGALERTILRAARARVETYARGEAQRYADPRDDPLYEKGTDPATAANRPCPAGQIGRGDGSGIGGRTCAPVR